MPVKGWKSITIRESIYNELDSLAQKKKLSIPKIIEILFEKYQKEMMNQ